MIRAGTRRLWIWSLNAFILGLLGCVGTSSARLEEILSTWSGSHPDELVSQWGAPSSTYEMQDKRLALTYRSDRMESRSLLFYHRPEVQTVTVNCQISFFTDAERQKILDHRFSGDTYSCYDFARSLGERNLQKPSKELQN